jgi:hypothetical protein
MAHHFWRLSEGGDDNLGLACTDDGLFLGRTPLIERRGRQFAVRDRSEIERLFRRIDYIEEPAVDRLMPGLSSVASAMNANDQCLARIAAVHLRIPDLPDRAARDRIEAEDALIKSADWNPALHPRTGTPPNPGWFALTDGTGNQSPPVRFAENDPISRSDAAQSIGENRIVLPPGQRNDELGDLLEWIANAKPGDEEGIRAEIKRNYYDLGDKSGGDALNSALNNVLGPAVQYKDRQRILDAIGPYSFSSESDEQTVNALIAAGVILPAIFPPVAVPEGASVVWELGWAARGMTISEKFGANLPGNFPVIDSWLNNIATSIKSIDLRTTTYQSAPRLTYRANAYIDKLATFDGAKMDVWDIKSTAIKARVLSIIVPKGSMTEMQKAVFAAAKARAQAFDIDLIITPF